MGVNACAVLMLFALAMGVNSTPADREGGAGEVTCTLEVPEGKTAWSVLIDKLGDCTGFYDREVNREIAEAETKPDYRQIVKRVCDKEPIFSQCVEAVRSDAGVCLDSMNKTIMTLQFNYSKFMFVLACAGDGERMATIEVENRKSPNRTSEDDAPEDLYSKCILDASRKHVLVQGPYQDPNIHMKHEYHVHKDAIDCMEKHRGQGRDLLVDAIVSFWSELQDGMKCVDPQHGTEILCKTIIEN